MLPQDVTAPRLRHARASVLFPWIPVPLECETLPCCGESLFDAAR